MGGSANPRTMDIQFGDPAYDPSAIRSGVLPGPPSNMQPQFEPSKSQINDFFRDRSGNMQGQPRLVANAPQMTDFAPTPLPNPGVSDAARAGGPLPGLPLPSGKGGTSGQPAMPTPPPSASSPAPAPQYSPMAPQGGFNVNQASASALQQSIQGAQAGMGFQPGQIRPTGYQANTAQATGYNPSAMRSQGYQATGAGSTGFDAASANSRGYGAAKAGSTGFQASDVGSQGYTAAGPTATGYAAQNLASAPTVGSQTVQAGQLAGSNLGAYTNPYENQVVQQTLSDLKGAQDQELNQMGAQATAANAFGGSRQGIAEAETRKGYAGKAAQAVSGLRQAGFTQAQQMAQADIGAAQQAALANQQAGLQAGTTTAQLGQQANLANQAARNQASQFGATAQNVASQQTAAAQNAAAQFGAGAANQAASQGANLQQAALQFGAGASNQAGLQNAMASNQARQFGAGASNQANLQNANFQQAASQFGAGASNQAGLQNAMASNQARQFGAGAANQAASTNMAAQNAAGQFGAGASNQMALSNMGALNAASQYNAGNAMSAQQQNVANQITAQNMRMGAGSQLGQLGQQAFNTGQTIQQNQQQQGLMQQGLQQALIDAARGQYAGYTGAPGQALSAPLAALGVTPVPQSSTQTNQRGLFDYLGLGAGMIAKRGGYASDTRLKTDIKPIGAHKGINLYTWSWNDEGKRIADPAQPTIGVMAQELRETHPHLVKRGEDGYLRVNYAGLNSELEAA